MIRLDISMDVYVSPCDIFNISFFQTHTYNSGTDLCHPYKGSVRGNQCPWLEPERLAEVQVSWFFLQLC